MRQFEYVVAGAGAAGLTMAYLLLDEEITKKSILILDKDSKSHNDRTWCFWEKGDNLFEELVYKDWKKALFNSDDFSKTFDLNPYRYKMIRALDFYRYINEALRKHPEVTWLRAEVRDIRGDGTVITDQGDFRGNYVFDSTPSYDSFSIPDKYTQLLQHFKGYFIKTSKPAFNPEVFTYMDLSIPQHGDFRFGYVLPFSPTEALVEYTLFSPHLLKADEYNRGLTDYIHQSLGIKEYAVMEEEFGVIPMTDFPFPKKIGEQVFRIGISGGFTKPSTGYTFLRSQHLLKKMVENLKQGVAITHQLPYEQKRFKKYDSTLLEVLSKPNNIGKEAFTEMFRKNGMQRMFRFLDEETSLKEELSIMGSTPLLTFGKAFFKTLTRS